MNKAVLDLQAELRGLAALAIKSIGWLLLGEGTYLHVGNPEEDVITVVVVAEAGMVVGCRVQKLATKAKDASGIDVGG